MFCTKIEKEIFRKTVRELTFIPCIKPPVIYESSSENKMGRKEYDLLKGNSEYVNERKRYERLLKVLLSDNVEDNPPASELITSSKIYDCVLKQKRIDLYNHVAKNLGAPTIGDCSPSSESLCQIALIDSNHPSYETIIEYYPQYCADKRTGVDFIEYILLLNISLTTQSRTLTMFQKLLSHPNNDAQINKWIDRVKKSIYSSSVYMSYVDTFFSNYLYVTAKKYNDAIVILRGEYDEPESRNADADYYAYVETDAMMPDIIEIHNKVIPTAWKLINCNNEHNPYKQQDLWKLETIDETIKIKAAKHVEAARSYIERAMMEAESIFHTLFEKQ